MARKSRKRKSCGESDGKKEEPAQKTHQERDEDQVPSSSSSIQKPVITITKRQTKGSATKPVTQAISSKNASTDNKLLALLKKPGVQKILSGFGESKSSTSALSNFKIPRKKNDDTGPKAPGKASASPGKLVKQLLPRVEDEKKACKRKSEAINTDQTTQSPKRRSSGVVGATKGKTNIQETVQNQTTNNIFFETSALRPSIKARRNIPSSLPSDPSPVPPTASTTTVDTPQMKQLKAQMASRNKKNPVRKEKVGQSAPTAVHTPQLKSTASSNNNSTDKYCPQRSSETQKIHTYNPISEILQIVRNEETDAYVQFDTTDAMDVDVIQTANTSMKKLMVIVDTNVWIGNQLLIQELLDIDFQVSTGVIKATVIIPWMVLQEIDHKIHTKSINSEFRDGAKFIHSLLSKNHPRVKGEKASDAVIGNDFNELMADDSILNCAIKCSKLTQVKAVLLTNDINLLNKALVHGLAAFKASNELISNLRRCLSDNNDNYSTIICDLDEPGNTSANQSQAFPSSNSYIASPFHVVNSSFSSNSSTQVQECSALEDIEMDVDDPMGMDESESHNSDFNVSRNDEMSTNPTQVSSSPPSDPTTFEAVATAVQQSLTSMIVPKMVEEYGQEGWKFAIKVKPPFTFEKAVKCIQAHWIAVFSYMFTYIRSKDIVDQIVKTFHKKPATLNSNELKTWRLTISQLALALLSHNEIPPAVKPRVADCCRLLQAYIQVESKNST